MSGSVASFDYSGSEETWPWPRRNWETKKCQLTVTDRKYIIWKLEKVSSTNCCSEHKHGKDRPANDIVHPRVTQAKSKIGFVDLVALQKNFPILPFPFLPRTTQKILGNALLSSALQNKGFLYVRTKINLNYSSEKKSCDFGRKRIYEENVWKYFLGDLKVNRSCIHEIRRSWGWSSRSLVFNGRLQLQMVCPEPYLIFVIFFTLTKFLMNKIYTKKRQFFALNL